MKEDPAFNDFMHDFIESLANDLEAEKIEKHYELRQEQDNLYFYLLAYLVIDIGIDIVKAQVAAAQEVTNSIKTPLEWQEWLKTKCQKHFPTLSWYGGSQDVPFVYGSFDELEKDDYLQDIGIEVGIIADCVTGVITFSISLVPDVYNASDSYVFILSRGKATIDEAVSEANVMLCTLTHTLKSICK